MGCKGRGFGLPTPQFPPKFQIPPGLARRYLEAAPNGLFHQHPRGQPGPVVEVQPLQELAAHQLQGPPEPRLGTLGVSGVPEWGVPRGRRGCPHLGVLVRVVPAGVQVPHTRAQGGAQGIARLPRRWRDPVVYGIDLLHEVLVQLGTAGTVREQQ